MMLRVEHLVKRYGPVTAVDDISFEVQRGEVVGFLGPNGAGKTTTMRVLTCFLPPSSGSASVAGHDVFRDSLQVRRCIGYLPEGIPLYPEMRVSEYLAYRARIKGVPRGERKKRVEYVMDRCGVAEASRKLAGTLSRGFCQRVGLADALLNDPPVLVLDEPTIGLDPNQVREVRALIRELEEKHTVILSTHILTEVETLCKRVIIIRNGRLVFQDSLENIAGHGTRVIVETRAPADAAAAALREVRGVLNVGVETDGAFARLALQVDPQVDVREEVAARVTGNGWTLRELRAERPSLEEIFVRLTAREGA